MPINNSTFSSPLYTGGNSVEVNGTTIPVFEKASDRGSLDQSDFLKIFVEQLKTQDPLNPENSTDMTSQVTNFSQLDEMQTMNKSLELMAAAFGQMNQFDELSQASDFVGKSAIYDVSALEIKNGTVSSRINFNMDETASAATLTIFDEDGNVVEQRGVTATVGLNSYTWDGTANGTPLPDGKYFFRVSATDQSGKDISPPVVSEGIIRSVAVDADGNTIFELGDGTRVAKKDIIGLNGSGSAEMNALTSINEQLMALLAAVGTGTELSINDVEALVGRTVRFTNSLVQITGQSSIDVKYSLSGDAENVKLTIFDTAGNVVSERTMENLTAGVSSYQWNASDNEGNPLPSGNYYYQMEATDKSGNPVGITTFDEKKIVAAELIDGVAYYQLENDAIITSDSIFGIIPSIAGDSNYSNLSDAASLLGKDISYSGNSFHYNDATNYPFSYDLGENSRHVEIIIKNKQGAIVNTINVGAQPSGRNSFIWDGTSSNGNNVATGEYTYHVSATDANKAPLPVTEYTKANVLGVELIGGVVYFTLSSGQTITADKINGVA